MVCLGNICRSPLAEGILQDKVDRAGLKWIVDSAGTAGYHIGEAPHHLSQKVAKLNGLDISKQKGRKFKKEDILFYDKIYVMDNFICKRSFKFCFSFNIVPFFIIISNSVSVILYIICLYF